MINIDQINFEKSGGLVPVIAQDDYTGKVLMLGYADKKAIEVSIEKGRLTFFSRSKNKLWTKGEESGNHLELMSMHLDCDNDTILAKVKPTGPTCHTGKDTCWGESNSAKSLKFIESLEQIIEQRQKYAQETQSYIASLFAKGNHKIAQKVGEEAVELVIESMTGNREKFMNEAADLLFHYLILLHQHGLKLQDIATVLKERNQKANE